ncbi:MAG TPA: TadE/TadG family type IV pilus assembly protein [Vicinamibacterales bacterium]|nr:TadE/TadG family type IV pilus assembly protein [Vicinamibacterales bacterium]
MRRAHQGQQRGVALVEMAIVVPFLLLVVFGIIEFGSAYNDKITLNQGVREGARLAARGDLPPCGGGSSTEIVECLTRDRIGGELGQEATIGIDAPPSPQKGRPITVCAEVTLDASTPIIGQFVDGRTIHAEATMRVEEEVTGDPIGDYGGGC